MLRPIIKNSYIKKKKKKKVNVPSFRNITLRILADPILRQNDVPVNYTHKNRLAGLTLKFCLT